MVYCQITLSTQTGEIIVVQTDKMVVFDVALRVKIALVHEQGPGQLKPPI
jgi:hypothetical protein